MGKVSLAHRLEYLGFRGVLGALDRLSDERAAAVGARVGGFGYPAGVKRDVVLANIRTAFPEWDEARVREVARASYRHLGRETLMMLRLSHMDKGDLLSRTRLVDHEAADADYRAGNGVVIVAGHLGNWEIGAAAIAARGYGIDIIAKRAKNPLFYRHILEARARLGVGVIDFTVAPRGALKALRNGRVVAFAADQHAGRSGVWVPFFGRPASTFRGPALMSLRTGAPMHLTLPVRRPDGGYDLRLAAVKAPLTGDLEKDVVLLTREYVRLLEGAIREHPDQYLWHHRRWRKPPPGVDVHD